MLMAENAPSSEQEQPAALPPLPDIGTYGVGGALRKRREQLGWSLDDVAAYLRIRDAYLDALETGKADVLPAEVYTLGFLRAYAQALGFDPNPMVERYRQEARNAIRQPELVFPDPPPDRRIPPAVSISLGLAVILASYVGWYYFTGHTPPAPERVPPVASLLPGEQTHNAPSPQVASILPDKSAVPAPLPPSAQPKPSGSEPASNAQGAGSASPEGAVAPEATQPVGDIGATSAQTPQQPNTQTLPAATPAAPSEVVADNQIVLKALAASWVQVKDANGKVVYDHILQPDEEWNVPVEGGPYSLTVGNAGGIVLRMGDVLTAPLGRNGAVRRKMLLTPQSVRDGILAAPAVQNNVATPPMHADVAAPTPNTVSEIPTDAQTDLAASEQALKPKETAPRTRHRAAPVQAEPSADDLNARQLQGMGSH
ncbi:Hypothetical protein APO_0158 [Acetobacter pomorum DM001]|uniref:HTH cro/C1-type domain-containing protein n=2 Tax=Acetobacteraceae TaxID=433 RepID=F1YQJ3_9PROT|nr:DUF4115 domain-containing protein [Acetobacter pomorum]AXC26361.1 helix-turn-helix domain-containing protein [Acetobacter sp. JWB]EGE48878.1 Hypothetical protein APO_0158 [Acetobacter pomorum DM001]